MVRGGDAGGYEWSLAAANWGVFVGLPFVQPNIGFRVATVSSNGDFNCDGVANAADYVWWRKNNGSGIDYNVWRANFGNSVFATGEIETALVPEPCAAWLGTLLLTKSALVHSFVPAISLCS